MTDLGEDRTAATEPRIVGTMAAYKAWNVLKAAFVPVDPVVFTETFLRAMSPTILASVEPGRAFAFDVDPGHVFRLERDPQAGGRPYIVAVAAGSGRRTYLHEECSAGSAAPSEPRVAEDDASSRSGTRLARSAREARRQEIYRFLRG